MTYEEAEDEIRLRKYTGARGRPVVVVPGFGGSALAPPGAQAGNTWLNSRTILDPWAWMRTNRVTYRAGEFSSGELPHIGARSFGDPSSVCDLCQEVSIFEGMLHAMGLSELHVRSRYFAPMRQALRARGRIMYAAPYDFRRILDPRVLAQYRLDLMALLSRARLESGGRRAVVVAHSMGCVIANHLMLSEPEAFERDVAFVIDICPAAEGSVYALDSMVNGRTIAGQAEGNTKDALTQMARNNAGLILSLPFDNDRDYGELVGDAWSKHALPMLRAIRSPGVPGRVGHVVVYGSGTPTPTKLTKNGKMAGMTDGDGVALRPPSSAQRGAAPSRLVGEHTHLIETFDRHASAAGGDVAVLLACLVSAV